MMYGPAKYSSRGWNRREISVDNAKVASRITTEPSLPSSVRKRKKTFVPRTCMNDNDH